MDVIKDLLDKAKMARRQAHVNMTLFPLLAPDAGEPDYLTLEEALIEAPSVYSFWTVKSR